MKEFRFYLNIPLNDFMAYYQGAAQDVVAVSAEGVRVKFPAYVLRPYLSGDGIYGEFVVACDEHNKFKSIRKVD